MSGCAAVDDTVFAVGKRFSVSRVTKMCVLSDIGPKRSMLKSCHGFGTFRE